MADSPSLVGNGIEKSTKKPAHAAGYPLYINEQPNPPIHQRFLRLGGITHQPPQPGTCAAKRQSIWLHRQPHASSFACLLSTDGCGGEVCANPDLELYRRHGQSKSARPVIAQNSSAGCTHTLNADSKLLEEAPANWHNAVQQTYSCHWYTSDFTSYGKDICAMQPALQAEVKKQYRISAAKDVSLS
jgi:hypothetical protein